MRGVYSTIDYAIFSESLHQIIVDIVIDEEQQYSIGSDHNFMIINIELPAQNGENVRANQPEKVQKWNINDNTNWYAFQNVTKEMFKDWDVSSFTNADDIWLNFKQRITQAGEKIIGFKQYRNKKAFWDREIGKLIKDRRAANKMFRIR